MDYRKIKYWYNNFSVLHKLRKYTYNRELALLSPSWTKRNLNIRNLKAHNTQGFKSIRDWTNADDKKIKLNYYYSLAEYKNGIPHQSFSHDKRKVINEKWKFNHFKEMIGYDLFIDVDCPSHELRDLFIAHEDTIKIHNILNEYKIQHEVRFSGWDFT